MEEKIRRAIQKAVSGGRRNYVIFPFGEQGRLFKRILNDEFGRQEALIIDSGKRDPESGVKRFEEVEPGFWEDCTLFIVSDHTEIYFELRSRALQYVPGKNVLDVLTNEWGTDDALQGILTRDRTRVFFNPVLRFHDENTVEALGNNTGNLVYVEALREQLDYHIEARLTREWVGDRLGRGSVVSVMPASNFVAEYAVWCESLLPILEQTDMRFSFVGLGAQAGFHETPRDVVAGLTEGQKRVFRAVGEHAAQIGVRGEFTAACMEEMGIRNVEVIGCPSFYQYKGEYPVLAEPAADRILYTADRSKKEIYALAGQHDSCLVCQNHEDSPGGAETIFYDFKKWNDFVSGSGFTFAFGSRFHGNMMALRNGIPALWIAHDWRTLELARYLGLPHLNYYDEKFRKIRYVEELLEYCDYGEVYRKYPGLERTYRNFIRKNFDENFRK